MADEEHKHLVADLDAELKPFCEKVAAAWHAAQNSANPPHEMKWTAETVGLADYPHKSWMLGKLYQRLHNPPYSFQCAHTDGAILVRRDPNKPSAAAAAVVAAKLLNTSNSRTLTDRQINMFTAATARLVKELKEVEDAEPDKIAHRAAYGAIKYHKVTTELGKHGRLLAAHCAVVAVVHVLRIGKSLVADAAANAAMAAITAYGANLSEPDQGRRVVAAVVVAVTSVLDQCLADWSTAQRDAALQLALEKACDYRTSPNVEAKIRLAIK